MRVVFDHQTFVEQPYGGISRYIMELYKHINKTEHNEAEISLLLADNEYIDNNEIVDLVIKKKFFGKRKILSKINTIHTKKVISKGGFDVFHATYYDTYFLKNIGSKPVVATYHDMIHELFAGKYHTLDNDKLILKNKARLANEANKIIAVSNSTKSDLMDILGMSENQIDVIHHGCSLNIINDEKIKGDSNYILYVGSRVAYKNFPFMLKAVRDILVAENCNLVCIGGEKFDTEEIKLIDSLEVNKYVQWHPITSDNSLQVFYSNAIAFIFPSLYEGFGMPILEAFSSNCPCLLSNTSSLPEVAGEAALYFDPTIEDEILSATSKIINNISLRKELVKKGKVRLKNFSWEKATSETINTYKSVL